MGLYTNEQLEKYKEYLRHLAETRSSTIFTNGGIEHASILMSILLDNTKSVARIFCEGFKPTLVLTDPYKASLEKYLEDVNKSIYVLIERDDWVNADAFKLLKDAASKRSDKVVFKKIREQDQSRMFEQLNDQHCNFAIFDNDKFRFEYNPKEYKAFGSFNDISKSALLINIFDTAFNNAETIQS